MKAGVKTRGYSWRCVLCKDGRGVTTTELGAVGAFEEHYATKHQESR